MAPQIFSDAESATTQLGLPHIGTKVTTPVETPFSDHHAVMTDSKRKEKGDKILSIFCKVSRSRRKRDSSTRQRTTVGCWASFQPLHQQLTSPLCELRHLSHEAAKRKKRANDFQPSSTDTPHRSVPLSTDTHFDVKGLKYLELLEALSRHFKFGQRDEKPHLRHESLLPNTVVSSIRRYIPIKIRVLPHVSSWIFFILF